MAKCKEEPAEFWLPSQFLFDPNKENLKNPSLKPSMLFPAEFPYGFDSFDSFGPNSALTSPIESVVSTTETETSDEEDFFAGLTQRLAQYSIQEPQAQKLTVPTTQTESEKKMSSGYGSPQSTLSGIGGNWSVSRTISTNGSPNGPFQGPSSPTTTFGEDNDTWDLIYAAAGQVARLKLHGVAFHNNNQPNRGLFPFPSTQVPSVKTGNTGLYLNQGLAQIQQARQDQMFKPQGGSTWGRKQGWPIQQQQIQGVYETARCGRTPALSQTAWPSLEAQKQNQQQPHRSGPATRAVCVGGSGGSKLACAGTGVFLPRRYGNPPEPRKKAGCPTPTVLLPAKVVQALNVNFDDMNSRSAHSPVNFDLAPGFDALVARRNALLAQRRRNMRQLEGVVHHREIRLPHEWTY